MNWHIAAARVEAGDPDRFAATMIAPVAVRAKLFPLYALNLELAAAAWASPEPLVCLMRLQFWEDAVVAFRDGRMMPAHDLTQALAASLEPEDVADILRLIGWRKHESQRTGFATLADLLDFLDGVSGGLMVLAARKLGADELDPVRDIARAQAIANWLVAVPGLEARGARVQPEDGTSVFDLAALGLAVLNRADQSRVPTAARPALWPASWSRIILSKAQAHPDLVQAGALSPGPLTRSLALLGTRLTTRV